MLCQCLLRNCHITLPPAAEPTETGGSTGTDQERKQLPEMLAYYADKGCEVRTLEEYQRGRWFSMKEIRTKQLLLRLFQESDYNDLFVTEICYPVKKMEGTT